MASSTAAKRKLSGSTDGMPIKVTGTVSSASVTAHTAIAGTTAGTYDEIWLYAYNSQAASVANQPNVLLTVEFGDTTSPDHNIVIDIPPQKGLIPVIRGIPLQNGKVVTVFASVANVVTVDGFVNTTIDV